MTASAGFCTYGAAALAANIGHEMTVLMLGLGLAFAAFITGWVRPVFPTDGEGTADRAYFFLGASLITACFFLTISYTYRLVFARLMIRWLFTVTRSGVAWHRLYA